MLIDSPRLKPGDREVWEERRTLDLAYARTSLHRKRVERAEELIATWAPQRQGYVAVSWGKDSVCVADLCSFLTDWPLVWVRVEPIFNPDCTAVRDAFLARYPDLLPRYHEIVVQCEIDAEGIAHATGTLERGAREAVRRFGAACIKGIRAGESSQRALMRATGGACTDRNLSPLIDWDGSDVFAYLAEHDLPVHPAYGMSMAGAFSRERLRVASLTGKRGTGWGRGGWEQMYYPEYAQAD